MCPPCKTLPFPACLCANTKTQAHSRAEAQKTLLSASLFTLQRRMWSVRFSLARLEKYHPPEDKVNICTSYAGGVTVWHDSLWLWLRWKSWPFKTRGYIVRSGCNSLFKLENCFFRGTQWRSIPVRTLILSNEGSMIINNDLWKVVWSEARPAQLAGTELVSPGHDDALACEYGAMVPAQCVCLNRHVRQNRPFAPLWSTTSGLQDHTHTNRHN